MFKSSERNGGVPTLVAIALISLGGTTAPADVLLEEDWSGVSGLPNADWSADSYDHSPGHYPYVSSTGNPAPGLAMGGGCHYQDGWIWHNSIPGTFVGTQLTITSDAWLDCDGWHYTDVDFGLTANAAAAPPIDMFVRFSFNKGDHDNNIHLEINSTDPNHSERLTMAGAYTCEQWNTGSIVIRQDGRVEFYLNGGHLWTTSETVDPSYNGSARVFYRGSECNGPAYADNLVVTSSATGPVCPNGVCEVGENPHECPEDCDPEIHVRCIGVSDTGGAHPLGGASLAEDVANAFSELTFIDPNNVETLSLTRASDESGSAANKSSFVSLVGQLRVDPRIRDGDTLIVYFVAHGGVEPDESDDSPADDDESCRKVQHAVLGQWCCTKVTKCGDELLALGNHEAGWVQDDELAAWFGRGDTSDRLQTLQKVFIMDGCFSGGFWPQSRDLESLQNAAIIASASPGKVAPAVPGGDGYQYTVFGLAVIDALTSLSQHSSLTFSQLVAAIEEQYEDSFYDGQIGSLVYTLEDVTADIDVDILIESDLHRLFSDLSSDFKQTLSGAEPMNEAPVAVAGPDFSVDAGAAPTALVPLDGSASYDPDGDVLQYSWRWIVDGEVMEATDANPVIELPAGQHVIELRVTDGLFFSDPDEAVVTVIQSSQPIPTTSEWGLVVLTLLLLVGLKVKFGWRAAA